MRIAIIGQQDFGKATLEAFLNRGDTVAAVFCAPSVSGHKTSRAKEPAAQKRAGAEIAGLAGQQNEHRLGHILSELRIAHVAEGHGVNPVEVASDQFGKRRFRAVS